MDNLKVFIDGYIGENKVEELLQIAKVKYVRNLYLRYGETLCQVDFVVVTENGILCLEVKNYKNCIIKGSLEGELWTGVYYNGNHSFYNPVLQNEKHIEVLKKYIHWNGFIQNVVLVNPQSNLDLDYDVIKNDKGVIVGYFNDIFKILTIAKNENSKLVKQQVDIVYQYLLKLKEKSADYIQQHSNIF